jgi:hypothetical protein
MTNPYIKTIAKIDVEIDADAIDKDVRILKEILERLSAGLNQEIILIMNNEIIRIDESDGK